MDGSAADGVPVILPVERVVSLEVKIFVALAPVILVAMVYALTQGNWGSAAVFAVLEVSVVVCYRTEKRTRSPRAPEDRNGA